MSDFSLTILMPCLNEVKTLPACIAAAQQLLQEIGGQGDILIADNGSTDGSQAFCASHGIAYIEVPTRGYGAALHAGIVAAKGTHILFADADGSYHFDEALPFINALQAGAQLVVGNRFQGGIQSGAMPFLHRYLGTPVISLLGRKSFQVPLGDFNCGMRAIEKKTYLQLQMQSTGMEYATELIARAAQQPIKIVEVPIALYPDKRDRPPHLQTWRDGWRHFRLILLLSPKWLLLFPAVFFLMVGLLLGTVLSFQQVALFKLKLDIHTLYFCSVFLVLSVHFFAFYYLAHFMGASFGLYPLRGVAKWIRQHWRFEKGILLGSFLFLVGVALSGMAVWKWSRVGFNELEPTETFRIIIPAGSFIMVGLQIIVFSFLIWMLQHKTKQDGINRN
jgi:glycosyltransferase involved in cell wall biosynthesis